MVVQDERGVREWVRPHPTKRGLCRVVLGLLHEPCRVGFLRRRGRGRHPGQDGLLPSLGVRRLMRSENSASNMYKPTRAEQGGISRTGQTEAGQRAEKM